jgi:hypothetical protein
MKTLQTLMMLVVFFLVNTTQAQRTLAIKESLPVDKKTNCYIRYQYFPNLQAYFDNLKMVYHFKNNGEWTIAPELPINYGGYSLYNKASVVIDDYDDENPYELLTIHKKKFPYNSKGRFTNTTASSD